MSTLDLTPDDDPLDAAAVGADDALVERLRRSTTPQDAVVWDDDDDLDDPGYALLLALVRDVSADLPAGDDILPTGVTPLLPRRRHLTRGATVGLVAAGVLSIAGAAAAAAPGQPLSGVRSAVASAVTSVVDAITPSEPVGPGGAAGEPNARPTPSATPPGVIVSAAARDAAAVTQIRANLDRAATLLRAGHDAAAGQQLDAAARKLALVQDADVRAALAAELADLRAQLAAPHATATHPAGTHKPAARPQHGRAPSAQPSARANETRSHVPAVTPGTRSQATTHPGAVDAPSVGARSHANPR